MAINTREEIQLDTTEWAPEVAVSASLGFLLSTYLRTPASIFHVCTSAPGQLWDATIAVDTDCSTHDYIETVAKSYQQNAALPTTLQTFWLRTDSSDNWVASIKGSSGSPSSAIPRQILCRIEESETSRMLVLEISIVNSSANARFLSQLAHVTRQLLTGANSARPLRDLDLICDQDRQDLQRWNQQPLTIVASTAHEMFKERVLETPTAQAVESWDGGLTYQELDTLSSRVCSLLLEAGAQKGDCVPLCFEKTLWTVVAMLGVLKTGCSLMLMDVAHPTSRLQTLAKEAKASIVLSSVAQEERAVTLGPKTIVISASALAASSATDQHPEIQVSPSDVAVVIFTSGTTGTPKGIQLEHKSLCSSLSAIAMFSGLGRHTRYFQFSSYAFDAGFGEILMTLMHGGVICIPSDADRLNNLAESMRNFNANAVLLTPTVVRLLSPSDVPCLTTLITGGERVTQDIVSLWGDKLDLVIVYGPAETTVACILKKARPAGDDETVYIGFPVGSRAWVTRLDDPNQLAPVGAIGELVAEGPGIGRAYINNEAGNAMFLDSLPWATEWESTVPGMGQSKSYRTGDLVRYADDGELVFVGRRDRQVKLRGQRIELEDIETKLKQHLRLPEAKIFLEVLDVDGTANLVAFLHHSSLREIDGNSTQMSEIVEKEIEGLRARISEVLPAYMWPVAWIPLKDVPLGPTGKLDRRKLLSLGADFYSKLQTGDEEDKDLSPLETVLARMWKQLLPSAKGLRPDAHFFQLGGDSLRCMKLVGLAKQEGFHLTMAKVFKNPTLSAMTTAMQDIPESHLAVVPASSPLTQDGPSEFKSLLEEDGLHHEDVERIFPCTGLQAGLFSLSLALPTLYSSQFVFDFSTTVDIQKFKAAWDSANAAFPILRTAIVPSSSSLVQVVLARHAEWTEVSQDLASFLAADKAVSFQPGQPLSRHYHVQDPFSGKSHFVWTLHHAVFDGWSLELVGDHIRRHYYSRPEVVKETGSYHEFVQFCESLNREECVAFWKDQLNNAPTPSFPNFQKVGHLAADKSCLRHSMAAPALASTTTTILARASWALLLSEYEGSDDVTFGNSLHGRNSLPPHLQEVVGPTITTLPIRVRVDHKQTVLGFLDGLQEQFSAMIPYEQFGLSQILGINQQVQTAASFRTLLIVQIDDTKSVQELGIRLDEVERSLHEYPLVLTLMPGLDAQMELVATFDEDVISPAQVQRILEQFEQTFHQLSTVSSDTQVGQLDFVSAADKFTMFGWNARHHKAYEVCVHELIRERVRHCRDLPAIYSRDGVMDYATLDRLSDGVAGELVRSGVKPGDTVGVLFEKSQWAIVSILAVIKTGAAYAPFSPAYPRARLEGIAHDAGIEIVVCSPMQEEAFPDPVWRTLVVSDETAYFFTPVPELRYGKVATPDSVLYILSTSGTTGTPKIFGVQHKCFATGAMARAPLLRRGPESRVLQFAPYAFDPSVEDILTTLMFGGCICTPSDDDIMGDISAFMKTARVNFANITPSVAYTLKQNELPDFKILLLSGEAPDQPLVDKWDGLVEVMNGYGPSECSVKCAINTKLSRNEPRNIGHSAGTSIWVVRPDNHNFLTPIGAVGELVIESPHLARGYMNRPEANDKFIESPSWLRDFRGEVTRMYKTGDLVRYMEDGSILYIGRGDMQLKLHGQRLEAEEVRQRITESLMDAQLQVIVDIARFEGQDSDVLVAYLARKGEYRGGEMDMDHALQQHLADMKEQIIRDISTALPKYMIPSVFLALTNIPVTSNGKADRRALKAFTAQQRLGPHLVLSSGENTVQPPSTETEIFLHSLWQKLLGLNGDQFGVNSNFFELGGTSLAAIKLSSAARDLGYHLSAQIIFKSPVLSAMAAQMAPLQETKTKGPSPFSLLEKIDRTVYQLKKSLAASKIDELDVEDAYPLTRQQQRYMEGEMMSPGGTTHRHIMELPANIDLARLASALQRVVEANPILRTRIISVSSQLVQVVLRDDFTCRHVDTLAQLVAEDRKVSWGLGHPLSRFSIVHGAHPHDNYLVWSSAHVVFDGWCRKLLLEEIDLAYHLNGAPPARPAYNKLIEHVYNLEIDPSTSSALTRELATTNPFTYYTLDGSLIPAISHTLSLSIDFPPTTTLPANLSFPTAMLTAWALTAFHIEQHPSFLFNLLLGGRDADLPAIDKLLGPVSTTSPFLIPPITSTLTFRQTMDLIQTRIDAARSMQHVVRLGDKLTSLVASAPVVVVHPGEDHEEGRTRNLGLVRNRVETVRPLVDAMFMNFCLKGGNEGVDLVMCVDERFFGVDKGRRYLGGVEGVLGRVFGEGGKGLDLSVGEVVGDLGMGSEGRGGEVVVEREVV